MTASSTDDATSLKQYRMPVGIGLLVAGVLVLVLVRGTVLNDAASDEMALEKPPMPATEVQFAENELIEQEAVNLDASLDLSGAHVPVTASRNE